MAYQYILMVAHGLYEDFVARGRAYAPILEHATRAFKLTALHDGPEYDHANLHLKWYYDREQEVIRLTSYKPFRGWNPITVNGVQIYWPGERSSLHEFIDPDEYEQIVEDTPLLMIEVFARPDWLSIVEPETAQVPLRFRLVADGIWSIESDFVLTDPRFIPAASVGHLNHEGKPH